MLNKDLKKLLETLPDDKEVKIQIVDKDFVSTCNIDKVIETNENILLAWCT